MRKLVAFFILPFAFVACTKVAEPDNNFKPSDGVPEEPGPTSLVIKDDVVGTGKEAKTGDTVKVHYTGTLMSGKKFDSSRDHGGDPFEFKLGEGKVIKGWDEGVPGMKIGGKRKLVIPFDKAYGEHGSPPTIPGKAALKFDIELIGIN